jgi:hypothetical protein
MSESRSTGEPKAAGADRGFWKWVCAAALVSAVASLAVYLTHVPDYFMGDDFELIGDALAGVSPFQPVSTHLRPIIRLHFMLYRWVPSAWFFGALSVLLHALASGAVFLALRETHGRTVAAPAALFFFGSFMANEAVFWASSAAALYCMIFSGLALASFVRGRPVVSYAWLILAALSYDLWVVVPFLLLFHARRAREIVFPFTLMAAYYGLHVAVFGGSGASAYGGFSLSQLPARFAVYAQGYLLPLADSLPLAGALVLMAGLLSLLAVPRYRFAAVLYTVSALVFSLSVHAPSRFYYFPSLALVLIVSLGLQSTRRGMRAAAGLLAVYLAVASPWINALDGKDYRREADLHQELFDVVSSRVGQLDDGEAAVIVNRLGPERLKSLWNQRSGRPKILFVREPAMAGMIYPDDAVRMALWTRDERPERAPCTGRTILVGRERAVRSTYCFRIGPR